MKCSWSWNISIKQFIAKTTFQVDVQFCNRNVLSLFDWMIQFLNLSLPFKSQSSTSPFHIIFHLFFLSLCGFNQPQRLFVLGTVGSIYFVCIRQKRLKELFYQQIFPWLWLNFLLQLIHYCTYIGTDFSIYTMNTSYLYRHGIWGKQHCANQLCGNRGGRAQGHGGPPLQVLYICTFLYLYLYLYLWPIINV